jgi:deubiquitinase DESI2
MCTNQEAAFKSHQWRHTASDRLPLCIRERPDIHGPRTGLTVLAGETFEVSQELVQLDDGRGWVFESKDGSKILCRKHEVPVVLHIYDVPTDDTGRQLNGLFRAFGTGAFHAGVEVFGKEWSFGHTERQQNGTGVYWCSPKGCEKHTYREEVLMGYTALTEDQVFQVMQKLQQTWAAKDYDILRRNCCHFSDALCQELGVEGLPFWVTHMANVGAVLDDRRLLVAEATSALIQQGHVTLRAVSATLSRGLEAQARSLRQATCDGEKSVIRFKDIGFMKRFDCLS